MKTSPKTMYEWFSHSADRFGDCTALEIGMEELTYGELRDLVERLATRLVAANGGVAPRTRRAAGEPLGDRLRRLPRRIADRLPQYMIPCRITAFEELPLNPNGKIDRLALAAALGTTH